MATMAGLNGKIQEGLNDVRILLLGGQVLVGSAYRATFNDGFVQLPLAAQYLKTAALGVMILGLGLLMLPASYHRIAARGENTREMLPLTRRILELALLPFALGMAVDISVSIQKLWTVATGIIAGGVFLLLALALWYALPLLHRRKSSPKADSMKDEKTETSIDDKVKEVLMEARMVLPGAQALLGFQVATMFVQGFEKLPAAARWTHLGSLLTISIASILLIAIAAYHRIAERGENTEEFHRMAGRLVLAALFFVGLGLAGDFFVVMQKISMGMTLSIAVSASILALFLALWYLFPLYMRGKPARIET